ncbi:BNR-4 repeat-containing protein [Streptomyces sp. MAR4 CNX-425]|uniref:BNR-4 repeat-containing protein n=1 Tax=Streptomyces sp. MAR4 CNX-425 TaxID=3406343 RepID=UPI003B50F40E
MVNPPLRPPGRRAVLGGLASAAGAFAVAAATPAAQAAGPRAGASAAALPATHTLAPSGAWCWFGDPRAVHHRGRHRRTFVGYITSFGDIRVTQYDHDSGASVTSTLRTGFQIDDHNTPSILIRHTGHVVVFWSGHQGPSMYYRRSVAVEDISQGWERTKEIPTNTEGGTGYTYPNPVELSAENNKLYLFWRGGNYNPTWSTTTGGDRWTDASTLVSVPGERPYVKVASNDVDTIHFAFTEAHPRNLNTSIYHMYYRAGSLYRTDGSRIGPLSTAVTPAQATKVYDAGSGGGKSWIHDIALNSQGHPVLTFARFPTDTDHRYHYAQWNGTAWDDQELTAAGGTIAEKPGEINYSGGITLDHTNPSVVLLSRRIGSVNEIERWTTTNGGTTWEREAVTADSTVTQVRPLTPRGLDSGERLGILWMAGRYPSYTEYQTHIQATS